MSSPWPILPIPHPHECFVTYLANCKYSFPKHNHNMYSWSDTFPTYVTIINIIEYPANVYISYYVVDVLTGLFFLNSFLKKIRLHIKSTHYHGLVYFLISLWVLPCLLVYSLKFVEECTYTFYLLMLLFFSW